MNQSKQFNQGKGPAGPGFSPVNPFFGLLPREFVNRLKDPFLYNIVFNTIAAGTTSSQTVNIQNDSDFVWTQGAVICTNAAGTTFTVSSAIPMLVQITDSASGRNLSDQAAHVSNWFGTAQLPFFLQMPKVFRAGGQITATLQNQDGANAFVVRFAFHGFKVFPMQAL